MPPRRRRSGRRRRLLYAQLSIVTVMAAVVGTLTTVAIQFVRAHPNGQAVAAAAPSPAPTPPPPSPEPTPVTPPDYAALNAQIANLIASSRARVGVDVVNLGPSATPVVQINTGLTFDAASTYKLPVLMANAEGIARGTMKATDRICYKSSEQEDGWYADYYPGECFTRQALATRAGKYSDNTAGHMLVDNLGGTAALNGYARAHGTTASGFFIPNSTTPRDLAALLVSEGTGGAGGAGAQNWLYPLLTKTAFEAGLPAGVPTTATVVHKVGAIGSTVSDVGIVFGPRGAYVIAVMTEGAGGDAGYKLIAQISALVWATQNT